MSRKAASQTKPKPRGKQGGRKAKYILPDEQGVEMINVTLRIRTDIAEHLTDEAARQGISRDEYAMRKLCPQIMQTVDAWRATNAKPQSAAP